MSERIKFSNGYNASVFELTPQEKCLFPEADLVREEKEVDRFWFARLFYKHKIAHLLFPEHFMEVVGAQIDPPSNQEFSYPYQIGENVYSEPKERIQRLFSKRVAVDPNHAIYASHMKLVEDGERGLFKKSICECSPCTLHRQFHEENKIAERAITSSCFLEDKGIGIDFMDSSDYCLVNNNIVFFEIDGFMSSILEKYLLGLKKPTPTEQQALRLLKRYRALTSMSRETMLRGENALRVD